VRNAQVKCKKPAAIRHLIFGLYLPTFSWQGVVTEMAFL
jgi:hypothetical protein